MGFLTGSSPRTRFRQMDLWNRGQQDLFNQELTPRLQGESSVNPSLENIFSTSLTGLEQYAQSLVAMQPGQGQMAGNVSQASGQELLDTFSRGPQNIDEYYMQTVQNPMLELFREDIRPAINRKYAPSGFYSSQRLDADQRASEDLLDALTQARTGMAYQSRESDLNRSLQAAQFGYGQDMQYGNQLASLLMSMGVGSANMTDPNEAANSRRVAELMGALQLRPFENVAVTSGGSSGILGNLIGAGGQIGGAYMGSRAGNAALAALLAGGMS